MDGQQTRRKAFWQGCSVAIIGHLFTKLAIAILEQGWHIAGHVAVGIALYILEQLIHSSMLS